MSLSGTTSLRAYTALQMLEEATSRAGIPPEKLTNEIVEKSLDQLNLVFTEMLNKGVQLWKRQKVILPCYLNTRQVSLPLGSNTVFTLARRSLFRQTGTPFTSEGGDPSLAFDDDFDTTCTQVGLNGNIGCTFDQATFISTVGILFGAAGFYTLFYEYTTDGTNWVALNSATFNVLKSGTWLWVDLDGSPDNAIGWRVRNVGTTPLAITELFFGNMPQEINLGAWNLDDYSNMPNPTQGGQVNNWYQQRNIDTPILYVWPVPNWLARYDTLVAWAGQALDSVTQITQSLDLPGRWYEAITATLARRLCRSLQEADLRRYPMLKAEEEEAFSFARGEERDPAPTNYDLGIDYYTRL